MDKGLTRWYKDSRRRLVVKSRGMISVFIREFYVLLVQWLGVWSLGRTNVEFYRRDAKPGSGEEGRIEFGRSGNERHEVGVTV